MEHVLLGITSSNVRTNRVAPLQEEAEMSLEVHSVEEYFSTLPQRFQAAAAKSIDAVFQFELSGDDAGTYHVIVKEGTMQVVKEAHPSPTATIKMKGEDYVKMVNGQLNGAMAFMKGQMKVTGNVLLAQKMQAIFPPNKK
jgi:putative sterol carrier protein